MSSAVANDGTNRPLTVYVVDDDHGVLDAIRILLSDKGYLVRTFIEKALDRKHDRKGKYRIIPLARNLATDALPPPLSELQCTFNFTDLTSVIPTLQQLCEEIKRL